jgi:hypothetical protein
MYITERNLQNIDHFTQLKKKEIQKETEIGKTLLTSSCVLKITQDTKNKNGDTMYHLSIILCP